MNNDVRSEDLFEIEPSDSEGMFAHLPWWLIVAVAIVVTELTTHPSIGVTVLCLKFGWNDFRTALWLRGRDPNRRRGAVCSWFYLSSGLWRVCLWSFALMVLTILVIAIPEARQAAKGAPPNPKAQPPAEFMTCMIVWLASAGIATVLTALSSLLAWWHRTKVWISGSIAESRIKNEWPPRPAWRAKPPINLVSWWLLATGIVMFMLLLIAGIGVMEPPNGGRPPRNAGVMPIVIMAALFLGALAVVALGSRAYQKLGASSPFECWPDHEVFADQDPFV